MNTNSQSMIGESILMMDLMDHLSRIAPLNKPVLVLGERGTGKELIAERLHFLSSRWDRPFIKLNCASMSESLLESELFGHEKGAFTGATSQHRGRFERADGGTLFLDELGTCSSRVQEKLLRVIEYGELERVGGHQTVQVDVRIIGATNADLETMAKNDEFRADLLDRLAFDVLHIPPLRYRDGDVEHLANHFAIAMCMELDQPFFPGFTEEAMAKLQQHHWPGNVRELKNVVERSVYRADIIDQPIDEIVISPFKKPWESGTPSSIDEHVATPAKADQPRQQTLSAQVLTLEKQLLEQALQRNHLNQRITAEELGLTYHQLRAQLKKHQMLPLKNYMTNKVK